MLMILISLSLPAADEVKNVESWAHKNSLKLNRAKSSEIMFVKPRTRRSAATIPPPVAGFNRIETIKTLGVTVSHKFSVSQHVDNLIAACSQTLYALHTLKSHGMLTKAQWLEKESVSTRHIYSN